MNLRFTHENTSLPVYSRCKGDWSIGGFLRSYGDSFPMSEKQIADEMLRFLNLVDGLSPFDGERLWYSCVDGFYDFSHLQVDHIHATRRWGVLAAGNLMPLEQGKNATKSALHYLTLWRDDSSRHPAIPTKEALVKFFEAFSEPYQKAYPKHYFYNDNYSLTEETKESFREIWHELNPTPDAYLSPQVLDLFWNQGRASRGGATYEDCYEVIFQNTKTPWGSQPKQTRHNAYFAGGLLREKHGEDAELILRGLWPEQATRDAFFSLAAENFRKDSKYNYVARSLTALGSRVLEELHSAPRISCSWTGDELQLEDGLAKRPSKALVKLRKAILKELGKNNGPARARRQERIAEQVFLSIDESGYAQAHSKWMKRVGELASGGDQTAIRRALNAAATAEKELGSSKA